MEDMECTEYMDTITLAFDRDYPTRRRHPWVFSGAVYLREGCPVRGGTVRVCNAKGETLGYGSYSSRSQIRVRMLSFNAAKCPDDEFVAGLVSAAVARRAAFRATGTTNAMRLVNAESDGLPGVVADEYDGWVVVQLASAGAEFWKKAIVSALMDSVPGCKGVYNRSDVASRRHEGLKEETGLLAGDEPPELIEVHEGAIRYLVDVRHGHKTGFYLDQREARAQVAAYAAGADVLNCFSYTGGFGLSALAGGAAHVTHLDVSASALELARRNTELCGERFMGRSEFVEADVFKQLRLYRDMRRSFDLIVLDPPKFADTKKGLMRAARGYKDINLLAMKLLRPGGVLATFSCSGAVTPELFGKICAEAAFDARRDFQVIAQTRQAADHPVSLSFPEGLYLKGLLLRSSS